MAAGAVLAGLTQAAAWAEAPESTVPVPRTAALVQHDSVPPSSRAALLGKAWKQSEDLAWTTSGDADGFHILTARKRDGYAWRSTASLSEPGFEADAWIGNACVTGSGRRAVVVYAPRTFTNKPQLMARGGFTAVVDLPSGRVTKLRLKTSLSYYNPGCGPGDTAVLTQSGGEDLPGTRLVRLDTATGRFGRPISLQGQVTSAVPTVDGSVVGAFGRQVVAVDIRGRRTALVRTEGVPYRLTPDGAGGLTFLDKHGATSKVKHIAAATVTHPDVRTTRAAVLAQGPATGTGLTRSAGTAYITGRTTPAARQLPAAVRRLASTPTDITVSTRGESVLTRTAWADGKGTLLLPGEAGRARKVKMSLTTRATGRKASFTVDPAGRTTSYAGQGHEASPGLLAGSGREHEATVATTAAGNPSNPVEEERTCSVPRNDPRNQAVQPKPRQVEWAVDMAVKGLLNTHISRPANWKNLGMPTYMPQALFLNPALEGGGRTMAQVMLGVTTQESNMWQASREAVPGVTASPLIGNYYGINLYDGDTSNDWEVDFAKADCGYGITQITDHMRMAGREDGHGGAAWDYQKQRAAALDYTANISAGLQTLVSKWNETRAAGLIANHGTSGRPENWYFALWAYNSGFHPNAGDGSPWGLGWANNPANPEWDAGRLPFMENAAGGEDASAAAHPQNWPYQEKVLGFAAHPPSFLESPGVLVPAFRPATWNGTNSAVTVKGSALYNRAHLKAPEDAFCDSSNSCDPSRISDGASNDTSSSGPCGRDDVKCWWHKSVTWKTDCVDTCGYEFVRFGDTTPEEPDGTAYPPACITSGLPGNALIVDDVPADTPVVRPGCANSWTNSGTFSFDFANNAVETVYPSKVDLHQLGAGFGGHFWFGHTRQDDAKGQRLKITADWKLNRELDKDARVWVHLPDHGAQTKLAKYQIKTRNGWRSRTVSQPGDSNRWVKLGIFRTKGIVPEVKLSTITSDGTGDEDIAFDAVAFEPGDWDFVPEIVIPEADPDAPDPEWEDTDRQKQPNPEGTTLAPNKESCGEADDKGTRQCVKLDYDLKKYGARKWQQPKPARSGVAAAAAPLVSWCDDPTVSGYTITRREGCHKLAAVVRWEQGGKTVGTAIFAVREEILLENKAVFRERMFMSPLSLDASLGTVSLDYWDAVCTPDCDEAYQGGWDGLTAWEPIVDNHWASATRTFTWNNAVSGTSQKFDRGTFLSFKAAAPEAAGAAPVIKPSWTFWDQVECDNSVAVPNSTGCIFAKNVPTWQTNTKRYPAAAAYYWVLREKLEDHPGSKKYNKPMHRMTDQVQQRHNRDTICNKTGTGKWTAHDDATGDTQGVQCDEFPFAATKESGGIPTPVVNGGICAQLYAQKQGDGTWRLFDDDRYDPPTWREICGRASMPGKQNGDAGRGPGLSGFFTKARVQNDGEFYIEVPDLEGCNPDDICVIRR
ncbi:hypothetical protein [Streptomyces sp. NBC_00328]|uniref:hypothetical protein n=1 Tax=Streptomyces sp. NBC_00328 TaxID=2903646 RepID=UPI002E29E38D|nr:hypothetical protein [Streptomyces sp. NBC_00328]